MLQGQRLGSCVLEKPLGVGGMGAVYLAQQERPRRQVAVKVLRPQLTEGVTDWRIFLARFRREADATAALDHANIVPIYEFGEEGSLAYLVMPYLANGSLADVLAREGPLPLARTVSYIEQIAAALDYAHAHGIVHRDVKPSNVLLHPDGRLLLADFGIARAMRQAEIPPIRVTPTNQGQGNYDSALTVAGATMGTPEYMAPEQVRGEAVTGAADTYALGILAYVMLTGQSPFAGGDIATVLSRQLVAPPMPVRTLHPEIPKRVEEVIFWALAKDPTARPASGGDFARALHAASRGRTLSAVITRAAPAMFAAQEERPARGWAAEQHQVDTNATADVRSSGPLSADGATLYDAGSQAHWIQPARSGAAAAPQWPVSSGARPQQQVGWRRIGLLLGVALIGIIALALVVSGLSQASSGIYGSNAGSGIGSQAMTQTANAAISSPTVTPQPTATPTVVVPANWLVASPTNVSLGCKGAKRYATIILRNAGPTTVNWTATATTFNGFAEVTVAPTSGSLDGGESASIVITNASVFFSHHGSVTFAADTEQAGDPGVVNYSTSACG